MTTYFSRLNPVPGFPPYTGPYTVGTLDVELPVSELDSASPAPDNDIPTVQYRVFYPCDPDFKGKNISFIPSPQREYIAAYTRFLGAGNALSEFISFFPRILHYIQIPALKNAPLLEPPTPTGRWPVMLFSHGLGGSRNAYSHIAGSIASHGMIVVCPEHRDGSTPISFIRDVPSTNPNKPSEKHSCGRKSKTKVQYQQVAHKVSPEVEAGRNAQLRIRLWEMGLIFDSLVRLDIGENLSNLNTSTTPLSLFKEKMDVHRPGKVTFAGHSFGASTITQLIKSTFYAPRNPEAPVTYTPLFTPTSRSHISSQITAQSPAILLDVWCLPLRAESTRWLWDLPFPAYTTGGQGGASLLAVESQAFYVWHEHLAATKRVLSPDPSTTVPFDYAAKGVKEPAFYYAESAAHLSQSDFGILFPWLTKRFLAVEDPERILRLNVRAVVQLLRNNGVEVGKTSREDMELEDANAKETKDDEKILAKEGVRGWCWISTNVDEDGAEKGEGQVEDSKITEASEAVIENELMKETESGAANLAPQEKA
ncbi:putative phospholipase A2 [Lachnellula hyalina]|uniref:Putative phospholipase n=1 Tax=Lachnellula hyalina TaxID=1316788 RepID=A0A8H8R7K6_9HELO|nr:putative phospholipase A2 [Lachnellula hyalina]TVY29076.1 putative phospholipase A2 [Lachnellula hyalina]